MAMMRLKKIMTGLKKIFRPNDFKKIHINDLAVHMDDGKRPAMQSRMGGGLPHLFLLVSVSNRSGFESETKILKILGKDPMPYVPADTVLGRRERLLEMPAGPGPCNPIFTKFELLTAKEAKEAMQLLSSQG